MKICTYNINGIRAAIKKGLVDWIADTQYDQYHFQETKAHKEQVDLSELEDLGYHAYWHSAEKKGYSGVLTLSKKAADLVQSDTGMADYDHEGRILRTDYGDWTVLNCYFPSGSSSEERHAFKMDFLNDFRPWVEDLLASRPKVIVVGDYNVVHLDLDIHNPNRKDKPSGFRPEERAWMDDWFDGPFRDAYRHLYPEQADTYSWWSYRAGARDRNKGWRIDYVSVSAGDINKVKSAEHFREIKHSDHCALVVEMDL